MKADNPQTTAELERLRHRERVCDSQCGPMQAMADAWYRAEQEFDLQDDDPYEAIKRLRTELAAHRASDMRDYLTGKKQP
jgi:hypothetical protein